MNVVLTTVETFDLYLQRYAGVLLYPRAKFPRVFDTHVPNSLRIYGIPRHPPWLILYPVEVLSRKTFIDASRL